MALDPDCVGRSGPEVDVTWTPDDALLYAVAVGVGAQDPIRGLSLTTENTEGLAQQVLPTFGVVLAQRAPRPDVGSFDRSRLVHAEQAYEMHRPLEPAGALTARTQIAAMEDKGSGALLRTRTECRDPATDELVFAATSSAFIRGAGGFGGRTVGGSSWTLPDGPPDHVAERDVRPEQALLYRLTGDRNPLHSDPAFAARGGFDRPILHGMCTYGMAAASLIDQLTPERPAALASMEGRFTAPVWPGDRLRFEMWVTGADVAFRVCRGSDVVIDRGQARVESR